MPFTSQCLDYHIRNRLPAPLTLRAEPVCVTVDTPCVSLFLYEWGTTVERIATLRAEEVTNVPLCAARYNDFPFDRCFAGFAAWGEKFMEIKMTEEARGFVGSIFVLKALHVRGGRVRGEECDVSAREAGANAFDAFGMFVGRLGIEGYALKVLTALVAREAFGMKAGTSCGDNPTCNGQGALGTKSASAYSSRGPMGAWSRSTIVTMRLCNVVLRVR